MSTKIFIGIVAVAVFLGASGYYFLPSQVGEIVDQGTDGQAYRDTAYGFEFRYRDGLKLATMGVDDKAFIPNATTPCLLTGNAYQAMELEANTNTDNYAQSYLSLCVFDDQIVFGQMNPNATLGDYAKSRYASSLHGQFKPVILTNGLQGLELNNPDFRAFYVRLVSGRVLEITAEDEEIMKKVKSTLSVF